MLSLALAFALFFSIIHSLRVLKQEYRHLMVLGIVDSFRSFIKKLIPLTLISLIGIAGLSFFQREGILPVSELVLIMITVSLVTLPHSIVMESFYKERG